MSEDDLRKWTAAARYLVAALERQGIARERAREMVREAWKCAGLPVLRKGTDHD